MRCWPVRVLLAGCLPKKLKRSLAGHDARTVPECSWGGCQNGRLLALAPKHFEDFVTADRSLSLQHNLDRYDIAVVVLAAPSNAIEVLEPLMPMVEQTLATIRPGEVVHIGDSTQ